MNESRKKLIEDCKRDIQRYEPYGKVFYEFSWSNIVNLQIPIDETSLHYGLDYCKSMMKLKTLLDQRHTDNEVEKRLHKIDADIRLMEKVLKHDLDHRGLLLHL